MITVLVHFKVKDIETEKFIEYTNNNVFNSLQEAGVVKFEFYRDKAIQNSFYLMETYKTPEDQLKHRETAHYANWKANISDLMEAPYTIAQLECL
jgi:quinol monooxygenase YgiN